MVLPIHALLMLTPGAKISVQVPMLENAARTSLMSLAFTLMTPSVVPAPDGEKLQAFALLLPDATATNTPELARLIVAWFTDNKAPPPRLMFATAGFTAFAATQFIPEITLAKVPLPLQSSTR